ncbi:sphingomyelin phosphodiesterase isoform X1 [Gadus chalcogrammus]|uniref:sphingomyelin phosphodiesterase isoform X1 n=2 Tax=Gadus chalcogrammus TaxID=1042646 RepID=UPI0024C40F11|nr:sphingomyelin phosphodiesterase isoform X1 [Gadus chalcogrammus]
MKHRTRSKHLSGELCKLCLEAGRTGVRYHVISQLTPRLVYSACIKLAAEGTKSRTWGKITRLRKQLPTTLPHICSPGEEQPTLCEVFNRRNTLWTIACRKMRISAELSKLAFISCAAFVLLSVFVTTHPVENAEKPNPLPIEMFSLSGLGFNWKNLTCPACKAFFTILDIALLTDENEERVARAVGEACIRLHLADAEVCRQITELFRNDFIRALQYSLLWPSEACALLVGPSCGKFDLYAPWNVTLPKVPKPPVTPPSPPPPGSPQSRVLFLTDIHWDQEYSAGSSADCKEPLCCRNESNAPVWHHREAGYWGTYSKCDLPLRTVKNLLEDVARTGPWDWVYWTGDIPAHNVWSQTRKQQLSELSIISRLIHKNLGPNVTVYPAIGNHESTPVNSFPPPFVHGNRSLAWLYNAMAEEWAPWLPEQALKTLRYAGFYSVLVQPGLRLVSLNMNFCARENFWLMVNSSDPANQLQWLVHILQASEDLGEKVHIIGHIPPGLCLSSWSWNYYHILNRYESTITGQFFGHTHVDEFQMFYDEETMTRPVGVAFIAPSATTYINLNPGYRVYFVDGNYKGSSRLVVDHETYILNLTEVNHKRPGYGGAVSIPDPSPKWSRLYRATEAYGLSTLFPSDWEGLLRGFVDDDRVFQRFWYLMHKGHVSAPCKDTCKTSLLCFLRSGKYDELQQCDLLNGFGGDMALAARKTLC